MASYNFTNIQHEPRKKLGLSMNEYAVAELIYHLSNNPKSEYRWCYASRQTIADYLDLSKQTILTIIASLIKKDLVKKHLSTKHLQTTANWYENTIARTGKETLPSVKKLYRTGKETLPTIGKETLPNNDIYNNDNNKDISNGHAVAENPGINNLIEMFKPVNPSYQKLYPNKTQRSALERLVKLNGYEKIRGVLERLPEVVSMKYAPIITTPIQFENKLGELILFMRKEASGQKRAVDLSHL